MSGIQINNDDDSDRDEQLTTSAYRELILNKLEQLGSGSRWIWMTFILCLTPSILNGFHTSSYVFLGQMPEDFWCAIPELEQGDWTLEQMRNISSPDNHSKCHVLNWDYHLLSNHSYEEALELTMSMPRPAFVRCGRNHNSYLAYDQKPGVSIVTEWDLVCDKIVYRTNVQMALSVGKFVGSSTLGIIADRYDKCLVSEFKIEQLFSLLVQMGSQICV